MLSFGTDGVRGVAHDELTVDDVRTLGAAATLVLAPEALVVGRDTRESGAALVAALVDGVVSVGVPAHLLGVAPTPALAHVAERRGWAAVSVTASHNPWRDNGVKVFAPGGTKLDDAEQIEIERRWHSPDGVPPTGQRGPVLEAAGMLEEYEDDRVALVGEGALAGLRVVVDCANGAMTGIAGRVLARAGAEVTGIADAPDGRNINDGCGAAHPEALAAAVVGCGADVGLAFDGDGDRVTAVAADGTIVDGDRLIAMAALDLAGRGLLRNRAVAVTVMTNMGFHRAMEAAGISVFVTPVGDRHVLAALAEHDLILGGEQSGHIVYGAHATTGDGLLAGLMLLEMLVRTRRTLADAAAGSMTAWPQILRNVVVAARPHDVEAELHDVLDRARAELGGDGRVMVRSSGTEPMIRVMVEAAESATASRIADLVVSEVASRWGSSR
jgi:phosphoglucosamine mutase